MPTTTPDQNGRNPGPRDLERPSAHPDGIDADENRKDKPKKATPLVTEIHNPSRLFPYIEAPFFQQGKPSVLTPPGSVL